MKKKENKSNVKYIEKERKETINPEELYFKRLEELSLWKINNMNKLTKNVQVHDDSANSIYHGKIKDR